MSTLNMLRSMSGSEATSKAKNANDVKNKEYDRKELKLNPGANLAQAAFDCLAQDDLNLKPSL